MWTMNVSHDTVYLNNMFYLLKDNIFGACGQQQAGFAIMSVILWRKHLTAASLMCKGGGTVAQGCDGSDKLNKKKVAIWVLQTACQDDWLALGYDVMEAGGSAKHTFDGKEYLPSEHWSIQISLLFLGQNSVFLIHSSTSYPSFSDIFFFPSDRITWLTPFPLCFSWSPDNYFYLYYYTTLLILYLLFIIRGISIEGTRVLPPSEHVPNVLLDACVTLTRTTISYTFVGTAWNTTISSRVSQPSTLPHWLAANWHQFDWSNLDTN